MEVLVQQHFIKFNQFHSFVVTLFFPYTSRSLAVWLSFYVCAQLFEYGLSDAERKNDTELLCMCNVHTTFQFLIESQT